MQGTKKITSAVLGTVLAFSLNMWTYNTTLTFTTPAEAAKKTDVVYTRPAGASAEQALRLLQEGNERFIADEPLAKDLSEERRAALAQFGQEPFAVIVSCSDSRVPPELVFDQALGDLFVVRVAGNVVGAIEMGSVEYAVEHLHTPLVVVMGHEKCGAVKAALDGGEMTDNIAVLAEKIAPAIEAVKAGQSIYASDSNIYEAVTAENVIEVVSALQENPVIHHLMAQNKVQVIGAKYYQETGKVEFFKAGEEKH